MRVNSPWYHFPWLYVFLRSAIRLACNYYFKNIEIIGKTHYPRKGAKIIAGNHRNGLSDPVMIGTFLKEHPIFITRADVFKNPRIANIFYWLKMLPIYRLRDKVDDMAQKNEEVFNLCVQQLLKEDTIILFPEGNNDRKNWVRPLKKGFARIAFETARRSQFSQSIYILPTGVTYSAYSKIRSRLLIWYGTPIDLSHYYEAYLENPQRTTTQVAKDLRKEMQKCIVHVSKREDNDLIWGLQTLYAAVLLEKTGKDLNSQYEHVKAGQHIVAALEERLDEAPEQIYDMKDDIGFYWKSLEDLGLRDHILRRAPYATLFRFFNPLFLILLAPIFLLAVVHHYWLYWLPYRFVLKKFKDNQFHHSVSMLLAMFSAIPYCLLLFLLAWIITGQFLWATVYLIAVLFLGWFGLEYWVGWKKWRGRRRYFALLRQKDPLLQQLLDIRKKLITKLEQIVPTPTAKEHV